MNPDDEFADVLEGQYPKPWIILPGNTYGGEVGTFSADFILYNRGRSNSRPFTGTVDTGAAYTVVPGAFLEELGIEEDYTEPFILADGSQVELAVGRAEMELEGRIRDIYVVFGPRRRHRIDWRHVPGNLCFGCRRQEWPVDPRAFDLAGNATPPCQLIPSPLRRLNNRRVFLSAC